MPAPYRLGILLCDHALAVLAARFCDYDQMLEQAFAPLHAAITWRVYDVIGGQLPAHIEECDGYLLSGSRHGCGDRLDWMLRLEDFIRALHGGDRALVGLCFGHQLMAQALGGEVQRAATGWGVGIRQYQVLAHAPWMAPALPRFALPVCHQDQVVRLPAGATCLAGSSHCAHFIVTYAPHMLGIQGHPEFEPAFLDALLDTLRGVLPEATRRAALASLDARHDSWSIKHWILQFLGIPLTRAGRPQGELHD
jgi:GMP synthase (glutamine-hydrolysing)